MCVIAHVHENRHGLWLCLLPVRAVAGQCEAAGVGNCDNGTDKIRSELQNYR